MTGMGTQGQTDRRHKKEHRRSDGLVIPDPSLPVQRSKPTVEVPRQSGRAKTRDLNRKTSTSAQDVAAACWSFVRSYLLRPTVLLLLSASVVQVTVVWGIVPPELLKGPATVIEESLQSWQDSPGGDGVRLDVLGYGTPGPR